MSAPAVLFDGVWKKFRRGERHDSLRDLIPSAIGRAFGRQPRDLAELHRQEFWALHDVSFAVRPGEALGIIGPNGAGKSTILKLLTRVLKPTRGQCAVRGRAGALIEVAAGFHGDLTGRENVFLQGAILGMKRAEIARKFDEIVEFAGVGEFLETPVKRYSTGMNARLGFAIAAHLDPDVLLIDEVLSVGDAAFREKCMERMRELIQRQVPLVFISHNLPAVLQLCTRALVIDHGTVRFDGDPARAIQEYRLAQWTNAANQHHESSSVVRILRAELKDAHGESSTVFQTLDPVRVRVHYEALRPVRNVSVAVDIHRSDGVQCAGIDTAIDRHDLGVLEGVGYVDVSFSRLALLPGSYVGSIRIRDTTSGTIYDRRSLAYPFSLVSDRRDLGIVYLDHEWSHETRTSAAAIDREQEAPDVPGLRTDLRSPRRHVHPPKGIVRFEKEWVERSVPECFAERASRYADRVAISGTDGDLSYRELDRLSDQVAQAIVSRRGNRPEPVALLLEHEAPVPAVMIGVLKAGKFFVPLDPSYPTERNRHVLDDSGAELLVTNGQGLSTAGSLGASAGRLLDVDEIGAAPLAEYPRVRTAPDDLAYVLYTSGSTGEPKGVMRTHRGLLHNVMRGTDTRQVCAGDRIALLFSYSFSAAVGNAFTALLNGATLLPFNLRELGVARLGDWLIEREVTHFHTVPTVFRHLTDALTKGHAFPRLRHIQLGGETMFAKDAERFKEHFGSHCVLTVGMGTSESGHIFEFGIDKDTECSTDLLPVGYQVEGTEIFLLDANGEPVGVGRVGEIAVRGSFVSPGYWRRPDLTARKFRPDPKGGNERIYLTGDLACRLPDGCVFHLGRNDARVRIRSQSVEIPEVEAALFHVAGVREAAVAAEGSSGDLRLVAYVALTAEARLTAGAMRQAVSERLPAYMVPSDFIVLDALPLLPNGKVDRLALSQSKQTRRQERPFHAPRTPVEESLAKIWAEVLGIERVGIDENFFELGGHSLLTMRLFTHIEKVFGQRLPLATILQAPTVMQLAGILAQGELSAPVPSLVALQPNGSKPPFFWVHGENSNAFLPRYLGPDQPVYALLEQSRDGRRARYTKLEDIAGYYLKGIRSVQPSGPYFLGGFCFGGILAFEIAQQLRRQGQEIGLLTMVDPHYGELRRPPMAHEGWRRRLSRHLRALALFGSQQKVAYLGNGFVTMTRRQLKHMAETTKKLMSKVYITTGAGYIPVSLRIPYINAVHSRAKRRYVPQVFPGRLVTLRTSDSFFDPESVWGRLAAGGLETHRLPGQHREILIDEAQIEGLAQRLKTCLENAQSACIQTVASAVSHSR